MQEDGFPAQARRLADVDRALNVVVVWAGNMSARLLSSRPRTRLTSLTRAVVEEVERLLRQFAKVHLELDFVVRDEIKQRHHLAFSRHEGEHAAFVVLEILLEVRCRLKMRQVEVEAETFEKPA